jgi:hypothetical protein
MSDDIKRTVAIQKIAELIGEPYNPQYEAYRPGSKGRRIREINLNYDGTTFDMRLTHVPYAKFTAIWEALK